MARLPERHLAEAEKQPGDRRRKQLPKRMSEEQVAAILAQPDVSTQTGLRDRAIMEVMLQGGLRVSEVVSLRRSDIQLPHWWIEVRNGKGGVDRTVPMPPSAEKWLRLWDEARYGYARTWFYVTRGAGFGHASRGKDYGTYAPLSVRTVQAMIARYRDAAGLPDWVTPHTFRHTFATRMTERRMIPETLRELMGHKDLKTTMIYTHLAPEAIAEEVRRLDQAVAQQPTMDGMPSVQAVAAAKRLEAAAEKLGVSVDELMAALLPGG